MEHGSTIIAAAVEMWKHGFTPMPLLDKDKRPAVSGWTHLTAHSYADEDDIRTKFKSSADSGQGNLGVVLGANSNNLVDVDLDHPKAVRLRDYFLPYTNARSGRDGRRGTHYWYVCKEGTLPGLRQYKMPPENGKQGDVSVELRSTRGQTAVPPSIHPSGEAYLWDTEPWGGEEGPTVVDGRVLNARVAMLGLAAVVLDNWPTKGSRHEAYLALAGGLLSYGDMGVHPFWGGQANAAEQLIRAIADASLDEDGADSRIAESVDSTIRAIQAGKPVKGLGSLVDIIGEDHVRQIRLLVGEVESAAGFTSRQATLPTVQGPSAPASGANTPPSGPPPSNVPGLVGPAPADDGQAAAVSGERDPLSERISSWDPVDVDPFLTGQVMEILPSVFMRDDGKCLMYPGRVNMLFGSSESAKSWVALQISAQVMSRGERVVYLDFEDEPINTLSRLDLLGVAPDDIRKQFSYVHPEDGIAPMQRDRWGKSVTTEPGVANNTRFLRMLSEVDPTLIVADGMSVIYGLHGLNTNDTVETDVITSWLKSLTRNGRTTVIVIDHTGKGAERGAMPIGSQHKVSMVMGSLLQVWPIRQPRPGALGELDIMVLKDRPGKVRQFAMDSGGAKAQIAATVHMDSTSPGKVVMQIAAPPDPTQVAASGVVNLDRTREAQKQEKYRQEEQAIIGVYKGELGKKLTMTQLSALLPEGFIWRGMLSSGKYGAWKGDGVAALKRLVDQGYIMSVGSTKDKAYEFAIGLDGYDAPGPVTDDSKP